MRRFFLPARFRAIRGPGFSFLLLLAILLPGCFIGDFISVYFNTYYNAQNLFDKAEGEVWALPETRLSGRNLLVKFIVSGQTKTELTQVIEKCSKLLQYHPDSRYVDDALLMIAKCYYYQGEYQSTERKCLEIAKDYPESDLVLDAGLLLACSRYKAGDRAGADQSAIATIDAGMTQRNDRIVARASLVRAALFSDDMNFDSARTYYQRVADLGDNREIRIGARLSVAEMSLQLNQYKAAEDAYGLAASESGNYAGEYRGMLGVARMRALQGQFPDALATLRDLRNNGNNREFYGEIGLETADVYRDMGDLDGAVQQYRMVDTTYSRTEVSARSYFHLGLLYENRLFLYDSARVAYTKGRSEFPQAVVTTQLIRRGDYMNRYAQFTAEMSRTDSLRESLKRRSDSAAVALTDTALQAKTQPDSLSRAPVSHTLDSGLALDSLDAKSGRLEDELATLFFATIGRSDSALFWYKKVLQDHPDAPYIPRVLYTMAQIYAQDTTVSRTTIDSLYTNIVQRYPESIFASESRKLLGLPPQERRTDPALDLYSRSLNLLIHGNGGAAIDTLKSLLEQFPRSAYAAQAVYAVGWIYENVTQQPESSFVYYQRLSQLYPGSMYAVRIGGRINDPEVRTRMLGTARKSDSTGVKLPGLRIDTTAVPAKSFDDDVLQNRRRGIKPEGNRPPKDEGEKPPDARKPETPPD